MASAYTRIAKSRMVSRSRPGGNGNGQRDGAADDLDGMDIGWLKPFATPRTGTLQKATDAAEAPTGRRHALVKKTWMQWRRPGCREEDLDAVEKQLRETGCRGGGELEAT